MLRKSNPLVFELLRFENPSTSSFFTSNISHFIVVFSLSLVTCLMTPLNSPTPKTITNPIVHLFPLPSTPSKDSVHSKSYCYINNCATPLASTTMVLYEVVTFYTSHHTSQSRLNLLNEGKDTFIYLGFESSFHLVPSFQTFLPLNFEYNFHLVPRFQNVTFYP